MDRPLLLLTDRKLLPIEYALLRKLQFNILRYTDHLSGVLSSDLPDHNFLVVEAATDWKGNNSALLWYEQSITLLRESHWILYLRTNDSIKKKNIPRLNAHFRIRRILLEAKDMYDFATRIKNNKLPQTRGCLGRLARKLVCQKN